MRLGGGSVGSGSRRHPDGVQVSERFELRSHRDVTHFWSDLRLQAAAADEFVRTDPAGGSDGGAGRVMFL